MKPEEILAEALRVLREGGTILYPTDTVWGLGCDATNPEAVARIEGDPFHRRRPGGGERRPHDDHLPAGHLRAGRCPWRPLAPGPQYRGRRWVRGHPHPPDGLVQEPGVQAGPAHRKHIGQHFRRTHPAAFY